MSGSISTNGEASSSNNNASSRGNGRGRKGRWAPLSLMEENFAPIVPATVPSRGRGNGRGRGSGFGSRGNGNVSQNSLSRSQVESQRSNEVQATPSTAVVRRHVVGMDPFPEAESTATSSQDAVAVRGQTTGKKNRRHRGRGKNQDVAAPRVKKVTSFMDLPFELREKILLLAHEMTIAELPACIPTVTNRPLNMSFAAVRARGRPPPVTHLRNTQPPEGLTSKQRSKWLWKNPGHWGPVFQVIYANKALHDEAMRIRYREIYVKASYSTSQSRPIPDDSTLLNRLQFKAIQDHTKYAIIEILHRQQTAGTDRLIQVLKQMKSLKHLCLAVRTCGTYAYNQWSNNNPGTDSDLLKFFDLGLETLSIQWVWANNNPIELEYYSHAKMVSSQRDFFENTYKPSPWYKDPENKSKVRIQHQLRLYKPKLTFLSIRLLQERLSSTFAIGISVWIGTTSNYRKIGSLHSVRNGIASPGIWSLKILVITLTNFPQERSAE